MSFSILASYNRGSKHVGTLPYNRGDFPPSPAAHGRLHAGTSHCIFSIRILQRSQAYGHIPLH
jgi:hypothetical protein